jgi:hypothetical protein
MRIGKCDNELFKRSHLHSQRASFKIDTRYRVRKGTINT